MNIIQLFMILTRIYLQH